jgi:hypothetical protein
MADDVDKSLRDPSESANDIIDRLTLHVHQLARYKLYD